MTRFKHRLLHTADLRADLKQTLKEVWAIKRSPIRENLDGMKERKKEEQISVIHLMFILSPVLLFSYFCSIEVDSSHKRPFSSKAFNLLSSSSHQSPSFYTDNDHYVCFQHFRTRDSFSVAKHCCLLNLPYSHMYCVFCSSVILVLSFFLLSI